MKNEFAAVAIQQKLYALEAAITAAKLAVNEIEADLVRYADDHNIAATVAIHPLRSVHELQATMSQAQGGVVGLHRVLELTASKIGARTKASGAWKEDTIPASGAATVETLRA